MFKGTIPVVDEEYDLSDPSGTAMTAVSSVIGVAMMFGIFAVGRKAYNELSQQTSAIDEIEVL